MLEEWKSELKNYVEYLVGNNRNFPELFSPIEKKAIVRKKESIGKRGYDLVKSNAKVQMTSETREGSDLSSDFAIHFQHLYKKDEHFYMEEEVQQRRVIQTNGTINNVERLEPMCEHELPKILKENDTRSPMRYEYDRRAAVQYAEKWWNSYNPKYRTFDVDCTNFISQCLHEGGAPMRGFGDRGKGWWFQHDNWSYSWAVAHAFRWYLSGSEKGLRAQEVESAEDLQLGDVICYDFEGDGHWNHSTIVVAKDKNNEPLVNAHTSNSRMRYWAYEDSTAWTPNIQYKFFHIVDGE